MKENQQEARKAASRQLGSAKEPTAWKTTGGAAKGKSRWRHRMRKTGKTTKEQKETQQTGKGGEKQEGTVRTTAGEKTWRKKGKKQP